MHIYFLCATSSSITGMQLVPLSGFLSHARMKSFLCLWSFFPFWAVFAEFLSMLLIVCKCMFALMGIFVVVVFPLMIQGICLSLVFWTLYEAASSKHAREYLKIMEFELWTVKCQSSETHGQTLYWQHVSKNDYINTLSNTSSLLNTKKIYS